jgi:hypothetical protein
MVMKLKRLEGYLWGLFESKRESGIGEESSPITCGA